MYWIWTLLPKMPFGFWAGVVSSLLAIHLALYFGLTRFLARRHRSCWTVALILSALVTSYIHASIQTPWLAGMFADNRLAFLLTAHALAAVPLVALLPVVGRPARKAK